MAKLLFIGSINMASPPEAWPHHEEENLQFWHNGEVPGYKRGENFRWPRLSSIRPFPGGMMARLEPFAFGFFADRSVNGEWKDQYGREASTKSKHNIWPAPRLESWFSHEKTAALVKLPPGLLHIDSFGLYLDGKKIADVGDHYFGLLGRVQKWVSKLDERVATFEPNPEGALFTRRLKKSMLADRYDVTVTETDAKPKIAFKRQEFFDSKYTKVIATHWHPQGLLVERRGENGVSHFMLNDERELFKEKYDTLVRHPQGVVTYRGDEIRLNGALLYRCPRDDARLTDNGVVVRRGEEWRVFVKPVEEGEAAPYR